MVAFSISAAVSWGDQVCAVKRLNYPRISGIQTQAPRRGPSTGDQRALRGVRWTGGEVEEHECVCVDLKKIKTMFEFEFSFMAACLKMFSTSEQ